MIYHVTIGKKDDEDRKKKLQAAQNAFIKQSYNKATSPNKGVSSGTPSSMPRAIDNLPKVNASQKAESYGPKQWNKNSNITTLPKAVQTLPRPVNNRLTSALERASKASDLTLTKEQRYRSDNFLKGVGMSFAATVPTLVGVTKQSLSDWHNKIKEEGLQSSLSEMGRNMDNPDWTYGNPVSTESMGYKAYQKANEYFGKAQEGLTPSQQKAMGLAASIAQNAVTLPTAFINPSAPLVIMGANAAANKANELTSQGKTATEALGRGLLSGSIEAATEKLPLDDLLTIAKTGGKSAVKNVLKQMGTEGAEELASYIMNYAADVSSNDKNAKFSVREALDSFLGGAVSGGIMGGAATAVGNMPSYRQLIADNLRYNSILPKASDGYSADVANMDVAINRKISDNMPDDIMPVSEYLDLYANSKNYTRDLLSKNTLALPKPTDYYATSEGITSQRTKESWSQPQEYETVYDDFKTIEFAPSGEFEANDGSLSDTDVKAFYFVKSNAEKKNTTPKKIYEALRKKRKNIVDNIVKENFEIYKQYEPQGTQLIPSTNGQIGGVPVEGYIRVSNNDNWYSEAYARYGHKPNQAQLKEFISLKVEEDVNRGGGEYLDKQTAKTLRSLDTVITGYEKVASGSDKDVIDIRRNKNGIYEVDYGTPRQQIKTDPTRFYQGRMALQERILPDAVNNQQAPSKKITQAVFNVIDGTATRQQQGFTDGTYNYYKRGNEWITVESTTGKRTGNSSRSLVEAISKAERIISEKNNEKTSVSSSIVNQLKNNINDLSKMSPVKELSGNEFSEPNKKLVDQIMDFIKNTLGAKSTVSRNGFGDIVISKRGVKSSIQHGISRNKAAAFAAVPEVLKYGKQIGFEQNWKGRNYDTYVFAAPIKMGKHTDYVAAIVTSSNNSNRYYLHEVVDSNGNIITINKGDITDSVDGASTGLSTRLIGTPMNNISPNNIIPQTSENINNSAPKELGERQAMPSVKTLNPAQIAKISEEDMNTTPPINRVNQQYKGNAESRFKKSMQSQTVYSDEFKKRAAENVNINTYDSMSNKEAFSMAQVRLDENGAMEANRWRNMNPQEATTVDRAEGMILAKRYEQAGDYEGMIAVVEQLRKMATAAGQSTQIFSALQRMTPEGMAYYAQKSLDNAREEMVKGKTQKWINENESRFHLTPEETAFIHENMAKIGKASSQREKDILLAEIQSMISEKLPSTTGEKMRTLARISMLFNAKTQIRNVLGNVVVMPRALLSDAIGSGIDKAVSGKTGMRTTGTFKASSLKGVPHGISEAFYDYRHGINTRNVQNDRFDLGTTGAFKGKNILSKGVKKIDDLTSFMLDAGDRGFYEMWYENSLANQMALNNVSEPTQAMEDLAAVEAAQRTWQDDNGYTSFVSDVKRGLNRLNFKGYGLGDIVMPFVKTPANLVKAVVDYSPVGVVKALMKDSRNLNLAINTGKGVAAAQRAYVNDLSKGITGTLLLIFYGFLADKGIIKGDASEDKDVRNFERNILGMLPYSVKIGDKTYSYEWAQPVGGTAAVAANAVEGYKASRQQGGTGLASVTNALYSGVRAMGTTLFNLSFLEGLKNFFNSGDPIKGITESVGAELSKFLPTALGQVAQTMDEYNRTTYVYGNPLRTNINKALLKIPGARETLPAAVDVLGRKVKGHNSVADAFINPVNYGEENTLPTADEIYSLYKETGNKSVIPPTAPYTVTYKGNTVTLSPEQTAQYQTVTGTIINKSVENLTKNSDYRHMRADEKAEVLNDIYAYAQEKAKDDVISIYELSNTSKEADEAAEHGLSEADYFFYKYYLNRKDEDKKKMSNEQKRDKLKNNKYLTVREKELLDDLLIDDGIYMPKEKNVDYGNHESFKITQMSDSAQEKWTIFKNAGMSADEYSKVYPIAAGNGKKVDKIAKLQSMGYSYNDAVWIYKQATKKKK